MKIKLLLAGALLTYCYGIAWAAQTTGSTVPRKGGYCVCNAFLGASSAFNCEYLGQVTIRQIYEKGWRVVLKQDNVKNVSGVTSLIIEEQ